MTNLIKLMASPVLVFGLVTVANTASILPATDGFKMYQSDMDKTTDAGEKNKAGEEEPEC